jgi:hypothetical protein
MIRFVESTTLKEGTMFYTLEGALETFEKFKEFQNFAWGRCGGDDILHDALFEVGDRIKELIRIRNTDEFSHVVSDDKIDLPDGRYKAVWHGYTIEFENGLTIEVLPYEENLDKVRKTKEHPETIMVHVQHGTARVPGYDI